MSTRDDEVRAAFPEVHVSEEGGFTTYRIDAAVEGEFRFVDCRPEASSDVVIMLLKLNRVG